MLHAQKLRQMGVALNFKLYPELTFGISDAAVSCLEDFFTRQLNTAFGEGEEQESDDGAESGEEIDANVDLEGGRPMSRQVSPSSRPASKERLPSKEGNLAAALQAGRQPSKEGNLEAALQPGRL